MDWAGVSVRFALYLDLTVAFGVAFFALCAPQARGVSQDEQARQILGLRPAA